QVFHNHSAWDGNDPAANDQDDNAIDTSKSALLPGQTATFANFTSDYAGVTGMMMDVANLPVTGALSPSDFTFKFGSGGDPGGWSAAAAPATILVRRGRGVNGSDRVELVWDDGAVKNGW